MSSPVTEPVHALAHKSKTPQRLGSLLAVVILASDSRSTSSSELASAYSALITNRVTLPDAAFADTERYLRQRNLLRKYSTPLQSIEIQDWLLADPQLPSGTGSEREDTRPTVELARMLQLITDTGRRTWLGKMLVQVGGANADTFRAADRATNPYLLDREARLVLAWTVLSSDLDVLKIVARCVTANNPKQPDNTPAIFDRVADQLPAELVNLRARESIETRPAIDAIEAVVRSVQRIPGGRSASSEGVTVQTVRRAFEDFLFWRLELLVDLQLLAKPDPWRFGYYSKQSTRSWTTVNDNLESQLLGSYMPLLGSETEMVDDRETFELLKLANREFSNSMGYSLIAEATLGANILLLRSGERRYLEESTARRVIEDPPESASILTSVDRSRRLSAFKVKAN